MKIIYLFIFICCYNFVYSQLNPNDYKCANDIVIKLGVNISAISYNSTTSQYNYCASGGVFNCDYNNAYIESMALTQTTTDTLYSADLNGLVKLEHVLLNQVHISTEFIQYINSYVLDIINCYNATSLPPKVGSNSLTIENSPSFSGNISLSMFNQWSSFELVNAQSISLMDTHINNDLTYPLTMDIFYSYTNSIPIFDNVYIYEVDLYLTPIFHTQYSNTVSNFKTFTNILDLYMYYLGTIDFPTGFFTAVGSNMTYLSLDGTLSAPTSEISLNLGQTKIIGLYLLQVGTLFHINNKIPFTSFGSQIIYFTVIRGNYTGEQNFNKFSKMKKLTISDSKYTFKLPRFTNQILEQLDLSDNSLTGTIDDSYCSIGNVDFSGNKLTGSLPTCFSCHLDPSLFVGNSITGITYPYKTCTTIQLNIYVDRKNKKLVMYGKDLGLKPSDFYTMGYYGNWNISVPSYRFEASYDSFMNTLPRDNMVQVYWTTLSGIIKLDANISQALPPPDCFRDCTIGEYCDIVSHRCICGPGWSGDDCSINNNFYATSTSQVDESGGLVTLYGWFTNVHTNLSVSIGGSDCKILDVTKITNTSIQCLVVPGTGTKSVTIIQNGDSWSGSNIFTYNILIRKCPNDCSSHGICSQTSGQCTCNIGYKGFDCSFSNSGTTPNSNTTIDGNGTTVIVNEKTSYQIFITHLIEIDFNNNPINSHILEKNWIKDSISSSSSSGILSNDNINQFSQNINQTLSTCTISYTIEEVVDEVKNYQFAGYNLSLVKGNVKISVLIYNYQYASSTNSLQLLFKSTVGTLNNGDGGDCNDQSTQIENNNDEQLLNYVTIRKDSKILQARFLNRIESDGRGTSITSTIVNSTNSGSSSNSKDDEDSITISLNLPHCSTCLIDPDFSVLVSPDFKSCDSSSKRAAYLIPVVVVAGVIAIGLSVGAVILIKKKIAEKAFSSNMTNKLQKFNKP